LSAVVAGKLQRATPWTKPAPAPTDEPAEHPKYSDILQQPSPAATAAVASVSNNYSRRDLNAFATRTLSPRVQAVLNQSFGKPNCNQCFPSGPVFRHNLAPMLRSNFLSALDWTNLAATCRTLCTFLQLWNECTNIDLTPLQGFNTNWEAQHAINQDHLKQATAALLQQFDGDAGALVRWIGGPHVGAYRNVNQIITNLRGTVPDSDLADLHRLYTNGMPAVFNAEETEANYNAYERYGNHSSINEDPDLALQALIKEQKKGGCIVLDKRVLPFLLNVHLTPIGLINIGHAFKKLRLIWDASFRPEAWCNAINDMSTLDTEPPITSTSPPVPRQPPSQLPRRRYLSWQGRCRRSIQTQQVPPRSCRGSRQHPRRLRRPRYRRHLRRQNEPLKLEHVSCVPPAPSAAPVAPSRHRRPSRAIPPADHHGGTPDGKRTIEVRQD
jgi:hypothetical protein